MENKNLNNSLFYGNIVKLESASKELLNNTFFFVDYIDNSKIILISETMVPQIFHLNTDGGIQNIDKIVLVHQQEEGYCVINRLFPGKFVKIVFSNDEPFVQGQITKLENDMIVIKTTDNDTLYLDFEYSGLLEKYNIRSIDVIKNYESLPKDEYVGEIDDDVIEESGTMYSIDQQVNDYVEKSRLTVKNKKQVMVEIQKYKTLLEEYTNLEEGVKINKMPNNQLLYSLFTLNPKIIHLFSYYLHKELYYNDEQVGNYDLDDLETDVSKWQYSVIEKNYKNESQVFSSEIFEPNIVPVNVKLEDHHKKIKLESNHTVAIINKVSGSKGMPFFFAIGKDGILKVVPYDMVRMESGNKMIANGIVFKNERELNIEMNIHKSSNLLSKSIQNLEQHYQKMPKVKMMSSEIMKEKNYFDEKRLTFYEFRKNKNFKETLEDLNLELKDLEKQVFDRNEVSIYECVKKLSLFDISKLNTSEYLSIQKLVRENIKLMKINLTKKRDHYIRLKKNTNQYIYVPHENMYEIIRNSYLSEGTVKSSKTGDTDYQMGELLTIASIDNMELLLFELRFLNRENNIDLNDREVNEYISNLEAKINGEVSNLSDENVVEYSKYYEKKSDMNRDSNIIILSNTYKDKDNIIKKYDVVQYLYETIIANTKFNGTIDEFIVNLKLLLKFLHEDNEEIQDYSNIFDNEEEQETILNLLVKNIQEKQIRKHDKCYVEEEKKFYLFDGKQFVDAEKFNNTLSKKKFLQVRNSIDEFEDIKTKIINDSVLQYVQKNEMKVDEEEFSGEMKRQNMKRKINALKYNKLKLLLKYNVQKKEYEKLFDNMNFDEMQYYSPYINLLHSILGIDDLERKYSLVQRFITSFTIDNGDTKWFFCVKRNTRLVPKYLQKLSDAYLIYNSHDSVMKEICLQEGYISENGDSWIHKESGFVIRKIDFDTNYGYDENGFKIKMDTIEGIEIEQSKIVKHEPKVKLGIDKNVFSLIKEITKAIMNELSIKFKNIDDTDVIYTTMAEIFETSLLHPKYEELELMGIIYLVLSVILVYVQCKNITTEQQMYSSCNLSFSGFPYQDDETSLGGIEYLSCYLYKRVNRIKDSKDGKTVKKSKLSNASKILFKKFATMSKSEETIQNDLIEYIKYFLLKNNFIQNMISQKRNFEYKHPNMTHLSKPMILFKPSLIKITTKDSDEEFVHKKKSFSDKHEKLKREVDMVNLKIEEIVKLSVKEEMPLLRSHFQETFLVNFCCQDRELALHALIHSGKYEAELSNLVNRSNDLSEIISIESSKYLKGTSLSIPIINYMDEVIDETRIYNDDTIYSFLIEVLNLQSKTRKGEIPQHLESLVKESNLDQLGEDFHSEMMLIGKEGNIKTKKKLLEKYGVEFTLPFMTRVMNQHHVHQYEQQKQYKEKESEKIASSIANTKSKILSDFQFDYIENLGDKKLTDLFEKERELIHGQYMKFMTTHLNNNTYRKTKNKFKTLLMNLKNGVYLEKSNNEQFELYIKQLYNINYQLITLVPGLLYNNDFHNTTTFKHFNYAEKHKSDLIQHCQEYRNGINRLVNATEDTIDAINSISDHKDILFMKSFNKKRSEYYLFLLYLFYKIMKYYFEMKEPVDVLVSVNIEIMKMILEYTKNTSYSYENMVINQKQSKQSEKLIKTETLRKMKPGEREAETYKMTAKLGDWSYGNQSRVFKYYKQFYQEDSEKANEIKDIARELYSETITNSGNDIYDDVEFENSLTDLITNEETEKISMVANEDGVVYDDIGCELDDYE